MSHIFIVGNIGTEAALIFIFIITEGVLILGITCTKNNYLRISIHDTWNYVIYKVKSFLICKTGNKTNYHFIVVHI